MISRDSDEEIDALLGALGSPAGAAPRTSPERILAMAIPPVVASRSGFSLWVLAGSIAAAAIFGFAGGGAAMYLAGAPSRSDPGDTARHDVSIAPAPPEAPVCAPAVPEASALVATATRTDAHQTRPAARLVPEPEPTLPSAPARSVQEPERHGASVAAGTRLERPRFVGTPVGFGNLSRGDPFASIPMRDEGAPADIPDAPTRGAERRPLADQRERSRIADRPRASPFALAFDLGGRRFSPSGEPGAFGLTTGAAARVDLAQGAVRPVLEVGFNAGAGLFPTFGALALAPQLGAELEVAFGSLTPSIGWTVSAPLWPLRRGDALALATGPTLGLDVGRQDRPHFRARVELEAPTDRLADGVVDANLIVSGGVEIPLGTF